MLECKNLENGKSIITDENGNYLKFTTNPIKSFMYEDIKGTAIRLFKNPKYLEIVSIYVKPEYRRKGIGSRLIKLVTDMFGKDYIIFLMASPTGNIEYSDEEFDNILYELNLFYTSNNFICVNDKYGNYEASRVYLYKNKFGIVLSTYSFEDVFNRYYMGEV